MTREMTMEKIYVAGLAALKRELGTDGMIRFLQLIDNGRSDYTAERHQWLSGLTVEEIAAAILRRRGEAPPNER
jgi:hypothetical protein